MPLTPMPVILDRARRQGYAVGCFEVWDSYSLEAVIEAAEELHAPVIVGFGSLTVDRGWLDGGGLECMGAFAREAAHRARVPVSLFLNEAHTYEQVVRGILAGFNAVMLASWHLPFDQNVSLTREVVRTAHAAGVAVEGEVAGPAHEGGDELTDPDVAERFVALTGVDALAVSIGNVRLKSASGAAINLELLERLGSTIPVPLVIHGGTGFPREAVPEAIRRGITKFNVGTALKRAFLEGLGGVLCDKGSAADVALHLGRHDQADAFNQGKQALKGRVTEIMRLYHG